MDWNIGHEDSERALLTLALTTPRALGYGEGQFSPAEADHWTLEDGIKLQALLKKFHQQERDQQTLETLRRVVAVFPLRREATSYADLLAVLVDVWQVWAWSAQARLIAGLAPSAAWDAIEVLLDAHDQKIQKDQKN